MLRFSEPIKIRVLCSNLVEIHYYGVSKSLQKINQIICIFSIENEFGEKSRAYRST